MFIADSLPAADLPLSTSATEIVISASRGDSTLADTPLHATVLDRQAIETSPASTLDQLLRSVQGFNFTGVPATQSDPTGHQTKLRGLGNAKVLVLLDGVPVHDPFYLTTQWYKLPLSRIERVEVLRGGASSLWGNMAVAGVINIVTRKPAASGGELAASVGSRDSYGASLSLDHVLGNGLSFSLDADRMRSIGYQTTPAEYLWRFPQKQTADATLDGVQFTTRYRNEQGTDAWLRAGHHVQDQDISYRFGNNLQRSVDVAAGLTQRWATGVQLQANAWAQSVAFEKFNGASCYFQPSGTRCPSSTAVTAAQVSDQVLQYYSQYGSLRYREQGGSATLSLPLQGGVQSVQLGADIRRLSGRDDELFYAAPTLFTAPQGNLGSSTAGTGVQTFSGVFAQLRLVPVKPLTLIASARLDSFRSSGRSNTRTTASGVLTGGAIEDARRSAFNPSLAARLDLTQGWSVRAAAYRAFRAPGFNNTMRSFGTTTPTLANPDLGTEDLRGWEVGSDLALGAVTLGATWFNYDVKNQIATFRVNSWATAPEPVRTICAAGGGQNLTLCGGSANFYTNDQDGRSRGLELEATAALPWRLQLQAQYTYTDSVLVRRGAVVTDPLGVQLVGVPHDVAQVQLAWEATPALRAQLGLRWIGPLPIDTTSVAGVTYWQGGNTVLDASLRWQLRRSLQLWASATNLLDHAYSENGYTFTQPFNRTLSAPRTVAAGLRLQWQTKD